MRRFQPDVIHCTSPGFILPAAIFSATTLKIPLVMSYHTHLPMYAKQYLGRFTPASVAEFAAWTSIRMMHRFADMTLVTSPQMKEEMEAHGIKNVEVWRKGVDTEKFNPSFKS